MSDEKDYGNSWRSHRLLVMDRLDRLDIAQENHKKDTNKKLDTIIQHQQQQELIAAKSGGKWGAVTSFVTALIVGVGAYIKSHT